MISRVDQNLVRRYMSPSCRHFGYEPQELLGRSSTDWIHVDDRSVARAALLRCMRDQVDTEIVYRVKHSDGRNIWVEAHVSPVEHGGYISIIRDIDRRKREEHVREAREKALVHLASTDGLTRLSNRRIFDESIAAACRSASGTDGALSLLLMDVDHFKVYNDNYGHPAGDAVLEKIARMIRCHVKRSSDLVARYGGEEFAVLLPMTDLYSAVDLAQTIRIAIWDASLEHVGSVAQRASLSIGVATAMPGTNDMSPQSLLKAADEALYHVKHAGRNQVMAQAVEVRA